MQISFSSLFVCTHISIVLSTCGVIPLPTAITSIANQAYGACAAITSVTVPSTVVTISQYFYYYYKTFTGDGAFYACSLLSDITLNSGLTIIGYAMFYMGIKVKSITIPSSVTSVGMTLFLISYKFIYILRRFSV